MTGYFLIVGTILIFGSSTMIVWPRKVWGFGRGWRFANTAEVQLSAPYVVWLRLSGVLGVVMAVVLLAYAFK